MLATATLPTRFGTVDGVRIRYAESKGAHERSVLLTSPWPESVYAFDPIWPALTEHARLVAIDLPGFGQSERRADLLSPRAMGEFLARVIDHMDMRRPHIVAPDVGTSAALFAAAGHPGQVANVIVGTGTSGTLEPDIDKYRAMDARAVVGGALDMIDGRSPDDIRDDYLDSYTGDRFAQSMHYVRRYREELPDLAALLPGTTAAVLIIAGRYDRVALANAEFLDKRLPNSRLAVVDSGHFVWEAAPAEYASLVIGWITGDGNG